MNLYIQLFLECAGHNSLVPFISDTAFFAMKSFGGFNMAFALALATLGATAGQSINWIIGDLIHRLKKQGKVKFNGVWFNRLQSLFNRFGVIFLLFSWAPLCSLITVAAGMFGTRYKIAFPLLLLGQAAYYGYYLTH